MRGDADLLRRSTSCVRRAHDRIRNRQQPGERVICLFRLDEPKAACRKVNKAVSRALSIGSRCNASSCRAHCIAFRQPSYATGASNVHRGCRALGSTGEADMKIPRKRIDTLYDDAPDNPALSDVVERNIRTIFKMKARSALNRSFQERLADVITNLSGRMSFVYLHAVWFGAWLLLNTGWFGIKSFDPYPYGLLTMIVSLEAIFLSTFVLISQNRLGEESDRRADLDLHVGLLAEAELTRVLRMLRTIQEKARYRLRRRRRAS